MSKEVMQIVEGMDRKELDTQLAFQCAPLLLGIKISNILTIDSPDKEKVKNIFSNSEISYCILYETNKKVSYLLYRKSELMNYLQEKEVENILKMLGYKSLELNHILKEFSLRYKEYMELKETFPHELGLILGYPVEDVVGFIENQGKNFLYTGYWKVYGNLSSALHIFESYDQAKEMVICMVSQGLSIPHILEECYLKNRNFNINLGG